MFSKEETIENIKLIHEQKTKFQNIKLYDWEGKIVLGLGSLDNLDQAYIQYVEGLDEEIYHSMIVGTPISMRPEAVDILILGGGDGLAARSFYNLLGTEINITLVDMDEELVKLHRLNDRLSKLNENSLEKCKLVYEDAVQWIKENKKFYDIIVMDFPDPNFEELHVLYSDEFLTQVCNRLYLNGVISIQSEYRNRKPMAKKVKKILGNSKIKNFKMPFLEEASVVTGLSHRE